MSRINGKMQVLNRCKHVGVRVVGEWKEYVDDADVSESIRVLKFALRAWN